jgi:hypothetical protein
MYGTSTELFFLFVGIFHKTKCGKVVCFGVGVVLVLILLLLSASSSSSLFYIYHVMKECTLCVQIKGRKITGNNTIKKKKKSK